jgi:hypothetical protein
MGLRDLFRKHKKGRDTSPHLNLSDNSKIQQQDKTGLACLDKNATM